MALVVVADPDTDRRELMTQLLQAAQHTVHQAGDGVTFQTLLRISPVPLVVVVRMDEPELARTLLTLAPAGDHSATSHCPATLMPWAQRHAYVLVSPAPGAHVLATTLLRLGPTFARFTPVVRTAQDAVLLLLLVNEAAWVLNATCGG